MKYILSLILLLGLSTPSYAFFGLFRGNCNNCVVNQPVVIVNNRIITQTRLVVPIREQVQISEVKGLKLLSDFNGNQFIEVNGRIINFGSTVTQETKETIQNNKIIVEQTTIQNF